MSLVAISFHGMACQRILLVLRVDFSTWLLIMMDKGWVTGSPAILHVHQMISKSF